MIRTKSKTFFLCPKGQSNIQLTCNSGPKGLAWLVHSEATAQTMTTGIVRLNWLLDASSFFDISSRPSSAEAQDVRRRSSFFFFV